MGRADRRNSRKMRRAKSRTRYKNRLKRQALERGKQRKADKAGA